MDFRMLLISIKNRFRIIIYLPINVHKGAIFFNVATKTLFLIFSKWAFSTFKLQNSINDHKIEILGSFFFKKNVCTFIMEYYRYLEIDFSDFVYIFSDHNHTWRMAEWRKTFEVSLVYGILHHNNNLSIPHVLHNPIHWLLVHQKRHNRACLTTCTEWTHKKFCLSTSKIPSTLLLSILFLSVIREHVMMSSEGGRKLHPLAILLWNLIIFSFIFCNVNETFLFWKKLQTVFSYVIEVTNYCIPNHVPDLAHLAGILDQRNTLSYPYAIPLEFTHWISGAK